MMSKVDRREFVILSTGAAAAIAGLVGSTVSSKAEININAAMHGLDGVNIPAQITVLGTGGSGCWPALFAAFSGVQEMLLLDASDVSEDDMGRTCFRPSDIGRPKAEATADIISQFRPDVRATAIKRFVEPGDSDIYFGTVLFDGVDYIPLNEILPLEASKRGMVYTQGFYSGLSAGVSNRHFDGISWTNGGDAPVWPASAALCGILQIYSAFAKPVLFFGQPGDAAMSEQSLADTLRSATDLAK